MGRIRLPNKKASAKQSEALYLDSISHPNPNLKQSDSSAVGRADDTTPIVNVQANTMTSF
jgi:hypothetical protein